MVAEEGGGRKRKKRAWGGGGDIDKLGRGKVGFSPTWEAEEDP
jgi:hypothetical protein